MHPDTLAVVEWMEGAKCSDELRAAIRKKVVDLVVERVVRSFAKAPGGGGAVPHLHLVDGGQAPEGAR